MPATRSIQYVRSVVFPSSKHLLNYFAVRQALVAARIDLRTARKFPATVDNPTFLFQLNNPYAAGTNASLNYHCYRTSPFISLFTTLRLLLVGRVVRKVMWDKVHAAQCRAGVEPTGHFETPSIAPGVFYGHS